MKRSGGKRVALWVGAVALAVVVLAVWLGWDHIRFWWFFAPLGRNEQGMLEYRHRPTGMVFLRMPGGTFWMGPPDPHRDPGSPAGEGG